MRTVTFTHLHTQTGWSFFTCAFVRYLQSASTVAGGSCSCHWQHIWLKHYLLLPPSHHTPSCTHAGQRPRLFLIPLQVHLPRLRFPCAGVSLPRVVELSFSPPSFRGLPSGSLGTIPGLAGRVTSRNDCEVAVSRVGGLNENFLSSLWEFRARGKKGALVRPEKMEGETKRERAGFLFLPCQLPILRSFYCSAGGLFTEVHPSPPWCWPRRQPPPIIPSWLGQSSDRRWFGLESKCLSEKYERKLGKQRKETGR